MFIRTPSSATNQTGKCQFCLWNSTSHFHLHPPTPTCRQLINSSTTSQWTARLSTNGRCVYTVTSRLVGGVSPYMFGLLFAIHRNRDTLESNARKLVGQPLTHKRGYLLSHVYFLLYHQQRKEVEKTLCTIKSFFCVSLSFENYCD